MAWAGLDDELSMRWDVINQNHAKIGKLSKSRTARRERTRRNHKIKDPREFYGRYLLGPGGGSDSSVTAAAPGRERTSVSPKCQLDINALTTALVAIDLSASQILCCPWQLTLALLLERYCAASERSTAAVLYNHHHLLLLLLTFATTTDPVPTAGLRIACSLGGSIKCSNCRVLASGNIAILSGEGERTLRRTNFQKSGGDKDG